MVTNLTAKALGQRIRQLRTRKGQTQQDLAGNEYSKSYISAIEQGKTRPSLEALQRMASRLEVPASLLLDPDAPGFAPVDPEAMPRRVRRRRGAQGSADGRVADPEEIDLRLMQAELLVTTGHATRARAMLGDLLPGDESADGPLRLLEPAQLQKAYHLMALAAVNLEQPTEALDHLKNGMQYATRLGNRDALERMRNLMGLAYYQAGQPLRALDVHRACLEAIEAGVIRDPNFKLLVSNNIANDYRALHDNERADAIYEETAGQLEALDDFNHQAEAYWELAALYSGAKNYPPARLHAHKALDIYEAANNILLVAQMQNSYGQICLKTGDLEAAERHLARSLELCRALRMDCDIVLALSSLARISLERGSLDKAAERTREAIGLGRTALTGAQAAEKASANGKRDGYVPGVSVATRALAGALAIGGEVATASDDARRADKLFSEAISIIETDHAGGTAGEIYQRYAQVLANRGQHEKASRYFEKAYRVLAGA
ncbi:MAG: helix-turn-helix domain-containing protein [Chloroflexia bacterium]